MQDNITKMKIKPSPDTFNNLNQLMKGFTVTIINPDGKKIDGAVGRKIEILLGFPPSRSNSPDHEGLEYKTHDKKSSALLSLLHKNGEMPNFTSLQITDLNNGRSVYRTVSMGKVYKPRKPNEFYAGISSRINGDTLYIDSAHGVLYQWALENGTRENESLRDSCVGKLRHLIYVTYTSYKSTATEIFVTPSKVVLYNNFYWESFLDYLKSGLIKTDIDISRRKNNTIQDRWLKFRIPSRHLHLIYREPPTILL